MIYMIKKVIDFIKELDIPNKSVVIGLSGGVDSMTLLFLLKKLGFNPLAVHINHKTRQNCDIEEKLVKDFCQSLNVPIKVYTYKHLSGNFEHSARKFRYKMFNKEKLPILTAHHLDDSFEWSLMQQFKSSSLHNLGIPKKNNNIYRPLLCVSKEEIYQYAQKNKIPFSEDESNQNIDFERNYIRNVIVPKIKEKYPNYLKHFLNQKKSLESILSSNENNSLSLDSDYFTIESSIKKISNKSRGKLSNTINQLMTAIKNNKRNFKMYFSGNVIIEVTKKELLIYNGVKHG